MEISRYGDAMKMTSSGVGVTLREGSMEGPWAAQEIVLEFGQAAKSTQFNSQL